MNPNQSHGPPGFDRDRERDHLEEQSRQRALAQQEELARREREYNETQDRERQQREQREQYGPAPPHQSNAGSIPIHQPVASRLAGAMHSPGGLLSTHGGAPPAGPLGAPSGPSNAFGGPLHGDAGRAVQHNAQPAAAQLQQHQPFGPSILGHNAAPSSVPLGVPGGASVSFGGPLQQQQAQQQQQEAASRLQQIPFGPPITQGHQMQGAPALGQGGQQPILNVSLEFSPCSFGNFDPAISQPIFPDLRSRIT
jgi:paired amphipathic helix protein Sin3a